MSSSIASLLASPSDSRQQQGPNQISIQNPSQSSLNGPVAILWDIENCRVPSNVRPDDVAGNIRMALRAHPVIDGAVTMFSAYGDFNSFPRRLREGCQKTGVKLIDVPNGRKDAADKAILVDMFLFALDNRPPSIIILISGDVDFAPALHILGQRGYTVVLVIPSGVGVSSALSSAGRFVWDWPSVARGEGFGPPSRASITPSSGPNFSGVFSQINNDNVEGQKIEESVLYGGASRSYNNTREYSDVSQSLSEHNSRMLQNSTALNEENGLMRVQSGNLRSLKGQLVKLLKLSGGGMPLSCLPTEYQKNYGRPLYVSEYGAFNLVNLLRKMIGVISVEGKGQKRIIRLRNESRFKSDSKRGIVRPHHQADPDHQDDDPNLNELREQASRSRSQGRNEDSGAPDQNMLAAIAQLQRQHAEQQQTIDALRVDQLAHPVAPLPPPPPPPPPVTPVDYLIQWQELKPEDFSGAKEPRDAQAWFKTLESVLGSLDWPENEKVKCASFCLAGDAKIWWERIKMKRNVSEMTWADFETEFCKEFFHMKITRMHYDEFTEFRQGDLSVKEAVRKFYQLAQLFPDLVKNEEETVGLMLKMFRPEIALYVTSGVNCPQTSEECIRIALLAEKYLNGMRNNIVQHRSQGGNQTWKGNSNHKKRKRSQEFSRSNQVVEGSSNKPQCSKCGKAHPGECRQGMGRCYLCDQDGHKSWHCPNRTNQPHESNQYQNNPAQLHQMQTMPKYPNNNQESLDSPQIATSARVFSLTEKEATATSNVVTGRKQVVEGSSNKEVKYSKCSKCGRTHLGECRKGTGKCYICGQDGHIFQYCPNSTNQPQQSNQYQNNPPQLPHIKTVLENPKIDHQNLEALESTTNARVFSLTEEEASATSNVFTGSKQVVERSSNKGLCSKCGKPHLGECHQGMCGSYPHGQDGNISTFCSSMTNQPQQYNNKYHNNHAQLHQTQTKTKYPNNNQESLEDPQISTRSSVFFLTEKEASVTSNVVTGSKQVVEGSSNKQVKYPNCSNCGRTHLGECRKGMGKCYICGRDGHVLQNCPNSTNQPQQSNQYQNNPPQLHQMRTVVENPKINHQNLEPLQITTNARVFPLAGEEASATSNVVTDKDKGKM